MSSKIMKKIFNSILALTMGCSMAVSGSACALFGEKKEKNQHTLTVTVAESPASLVAYSIEAYINANADETVNSFLTGGTERLDKGMPVTIEYDLQSSAVVGIISIEAELSLDKDFAVIEQKQTLNISDMEDSPIYNFDPRKNYCSLYNLKTGEHYYYRVKLTLSDGQTVSSIGEFDTKISPRFINLDGANNVRDIGGWMTESGRRIKQGLLYRGSEIDGGKNTGHADFRLTEQGIAQLRALGIKTDFDLRSDSNKISEHSILGADVSRSFYDAAQYQSALAKANAETTRKIFSDLAKKESYPIYLHCTHGVDRAGTTCLLLEGLLGVAKEDLVRDYELSAFYYNYAHVNRNFENGGNVLKLIEELEKYDGETFADKVATFMLSIGVTADEINSIRSIFLG